MTDIIQKNRDLMPRTYDEKLKLANLLAKSGLIPKQLMGENCIYKIFAVLAYGDEFGLSPFVAIRNITVIDGLPTMSADLLKSLVLASGDIEKYEEGQVGTKNTMSWGYRVYIKRKSIPIEVEAIFTMEDANRAELLSKSNWKHYPQDMLRARATSKACKMAMPEILSRVYTPEELEAGEEELNISQNTIKDNNTFEIKLEENYQDKEEKNIKKDIYEDIKVNNEIIEDIEDETNNDIFNNLKSSASNTATIIDIDNKKIISSSNEQKNISEKDKIVDALSQARKNIQKQEKPKMLTIPVEIDKILFEKGYDISKIRYTEERPYEELLDTVNNLKNFNYYNEKAKMVKSEEGFKKVKEYTKKILTLQITPQEIKDFENFLDSYLKLANGGINENNKNNI